VSKPGVLFVCIHNAGRSRMAAGWLRHLAGDRIDVRSAGSEPADQINPVAVEAMREVGIDITGAVPHILETEDVRDSDVVITMGCGDACPIFPGKRYEDSLVSGTIRAARKSLTRASQETDTLTSIRRWSSRTFSGAD
jgi:arsenate reductase (thioredoxin)